LRAPIDVMRIVTQPPIGVVRVSSSSRTNRIETPTNAAT
jgi:hypothetical protein